MAGIKKAINLLKISQENPKLLPNLTLLDFRFRNLEKLSIETSFPESK
jgi:hypothetical protein